MPSKAGSQRRADVVVLTAITLEYQAALQVEAGAWDGSQWEQQQGPNGLPVAFRTFRGKGGRGLRVAVAQAADMGAVAATNALLPLVDAYHPQCVAMCGVCAGRPGKTNLGDVIAAERLSFHDTGKRLPEAVQQDLKTYNLRDDWKVALEHFGFAARFQGETWWKKRPVPYEWQENWVLAKLNDGKEDPSSLPECEAFCPQWDKVIESLWKSGHVRDGTLTLTEEGRRRISRLLIKHRNRFPDTTPSGELLPFKVHVAPMSSGNQVVEDEEVWSFISEHMRKTLGLEMEAAALGQLAHAQRERHLTALVMKGVMDFANHGRDDHFKEFAARASAECLFAFLREHLEPEVLPGVDDILVPGTETALPASPPPSSLLNARYEVVPFHERGREAVLAELDRWSEKEHDVAVRLLHAGGGVGKTRLAIEWIQRRQKAGWAAGFLLKDVPDNWLERLGGLGQPVLVVIDYAESYPDLRTTLLRLHRYQQKQGAGRLRRVRLLLLARSADDWWQFLQQSDTGLSAWLGMTPPYELAPLAVSEAEREKVFHEAAQRFAEKLGRKPTRGPPPHFFDERFTRVLYLHMAALASVEELPFAANTLLDVILEHEEHFWETSSRQGEIALSLQRSLAREVVAAATLRGGFTQKEDALLFVKKRLLRPLSADDEVLLRLLQRIYQGGGENPALYLPPLEPDLLGEGMVLRVLSPKLQGDRPPADWLDYVFPQDAPAHEVRTGLEVLGRASASWSEEVRPWLSRLLTPLPVRAPIALEAAKAVGQQTGLSVLGDVLAERLEQEGDAQLALSMWRPNDRWTVSLRRVDEWVTRTFLQVVSTESDETSLARAYMLRERSNALRLLGRHEEAIEAARASLAILHASSWNNPTDLQWKLALSHQTLGNALRESRRYEDALVADNEAIAIFQGLLRQDLTAPRGELAHGLTNKSASLIQLKRNQEAFDVAKAAVELLRPLEREDPERFRGDLCTALPNMGIAAAALGQADLALTLMEEALPLRRALARQNPDVHQLDLALLLLNMGMTLNQAGRHLESVSASQEAARIYSPFAQRDPQAYQALYMQSLSNLSVGLLDVGRHEEAIAVLREVIELLRPLVQRDPAAHFGRLANHLFGLGFNLNKLDRNEEAVPALREAVEYLRRLDPWHKDLPTYLNALKETLRKLGRHEEALSVVEDALAAIWPDFERDPTKAAARTSGLLLEAAELCELLHSSPSLYLATRFEIFSRLAPPRSGQDGA